MNFYTSQQTPTHIELAPLIDVVFLLLIFFMVSSSFLDKEALNIDLPKIPNAQSIATDNKLSVAIDAKGNYLVAGKTIEACNTHDLKKMLLTLTQKHPQKPLYIYGHSQSPHQSFVTLLALANEIKAKQIIIATRVQHVQSSI